ncbi:MAG: translocation/assembly module TamB domain-containing protein [Desulfobacterales bacterium]
MAPRPGFYLKKSAKWLGVGLLIIMILMSILFFLVQTDTAKNTLARMISESLSSDEIAIHIRGLDGWIPFSITVDHLTVADSGKEAVSARDVRLHWDPFSLIDRPLRITEVSASSVRVERIPEAGKDQAEEEEFPPSRPLSLPGLAVEDLHIEQLYLGEPVIGMQAEFTIRGELTSSERRGEFMSRLMVKRTDQPGTRLDFDLSVRGKAPVMTLDFRFREPEDGVLHRLIGLRDVGPLDVELTGKGPLAEWPGRLAAHLQGAGSLKSDIMLHAEKTFTIDSEGTLQLRETILPSALSPLFDTNGLPFELNLDLGTTENIFPHEVHFRTPWARTQWVLHSAEKGPVAGRYELAVPDLSVFSSLTAGDAGGSLQLEGSFSGPLDQPELDFALALADVTFGDYQAEALHMNAVITRPQNGLSATPRMLVDASGRIADLRQVEQKKLLFPDPFTWRVSADITRSAPKTWQVDSLILAAEEQRLSFSGRIDTDLSNVEGKLTADFNNPLSAAPFLAPDVQGNIHIAADVRANPAALKIFSDFNGYTQNISGLHAELDPLLKERAEFGGRIAFVADEYVEIEGFEVQTKWALLSGRSGLNLDTESISGSFDIAFPGLSPFSPLVGAELSGALDIDASIEGPIAKPMVHIHAASRGLSLNGRQVEQVEASVNVRGLGAETKGAFAVNAVLDQKAITARGDVGMSDDWVDISGLQFAADGAALQGRMRIGLDQPALIGRLQGRAMPLSSISSLYGYAASGSADLSIELQNPRGAQEAMFEVLVDAPASEFGTADNITLSGSVTDLFGEPLADISANVQNFSKDDVKVDSLSFSAKGRAAESSFQLRFEGAHAGRPLNLETLGSFRRDNADLMRVRLDRFGGNIGQSEFGLSEPLVFKKQGPEYELEPLIIDLGGGTITAAGLYGPETLRTDVRIESVPLTVLANFGLPTFQGDVSGVLNLSGRPEKPRADFNMRLRKVRLKITETDLPPVRVDVDGRYADDALSVILSAAGLEDMAISAEIRAPVRIAVSPENFITEPRGDLEGRLFGQVGLDNLPAVWHLENQDLAGSLTADLDVSGSFGAPRLSGAVRLENGKYENLKNGILLREVRVSAEMAGREIVLEEFAATDGEDGRISAGGRVVLDRASHFPLDLKIRLDDATLVRRTDLTAEFEGGLNFSGNLQELTLTGQLEVGPAEYRLPEELPVDVPELDVREINIPPEREPEKAKAPEDGTRLNLDIRVRSKGQVFIRGRGLTSEWQGKLEVGGTARAPVLIGQLSIVKGRYIFYDKPFELTEGEIRFSGGIPPLPRFNVTAVHERPDLTVRIIISGTPDSLDVEFSSDPALPNDEILSRLLFGKSVADITPLQALRLANAIGSLAGAGGGGVMGFVDSTRRLIGVDELSISPDAEGDTTVRIGKYLTEDVFVQVEKGFGPEDRETVSVEVRLSSNLTLESEAGVQGEGGAILNWRWDY